MNWTAAGDAIGATREGVELIRSLLGLALTLGLLALMWWFIKRAFGYEDLTDMVASLGSGPIARRRRIEKRYLLIRGPHYVPARDMLKPKALKVVRERKPKDETGGVQR